MSDASSIGSQNDVDETRNHPPVAGLDENLSNDPPHTPQARAISPQVLTVEADDEADANEPVLDPSDNHATSASHDVSAISRASPSTTALPIRTASPSETLEQSSSSIRSSTDEGTSTERHESVTRPITTPTEEQTDLPEPHRTGHQVELPDTLEDAGPGLITRVDSQEGISLGDNPSGYTPSSPVVGGELYRRHTRSDTSLFTLPRWQPDGEVTYCPICKSQFNIFIRKHHCRKCGRVVCNSCSPHRIIIPHQYIVRPPGTEPPLMHSLLLDSLGAGFFDPNGASGGERVRLCNPCVPDPNTAPPGSPPSPRSSHQRSRSSAIDTPSSRGSHSHSYSGTSTNLTYGRRQQHPTTRTRSATTLQATLGSGESSSTRSRATTIRHRPLERYRVVASNSVASSYPIRHSSLGILGTSLRRRAFPPTPQIAEEDECPVCHQELPSRSLSNHESLRESHVNLCVQTHSTYGSPRPHSNRGNEAASPATPAAAPRRTGMYTYPATEKDCIDDAECTICLEEFRVGVPMARLECLCRFHRSCIAAWFVNHPGRCPVHQHDGFGY